MRLRWFRNEPKKSQRKRAVLIVTDKTRFRGESDQTSIVRDLWDSERGVERIDR